MGFGVDCLSGELVRLVLEHPGRGRRLLEAEQAQVLLVSPTILLEIVLVIPMLLFEFSSCSHDGCSDIVLMGTPG
jgi:hypothetical protein